jgi:hypothetical protein
MGDRPGAGAKSILRSPRISAWRVDAAFLGFVIALVAVTAFIAFAWDTTRGKGRTWVVQEASTMTE